MVVDEETMERFKRCYEIYGDGIARLKLEEAVKDSLFQKNIQQLVKLKVEDE